MTTTSMVQRQCLVAPLLLCLLLSVLTTAHQLPTETSATTNDSQHSSSVLAALVLQQTALIQQLFQQQASVIDHLKTDQSEQASTIDQLKTDLSEQASTIDHLKNGQSAVHAELSDNKKQLEGLRSGLDSFKTQTQGELQDLKTGSQSVAFTAKMSKDFVPLTSAQTVVFDDVLTNVGGAYDPHHGIFTAPADGTYVFFLTMMTVNAAGELYLAVIKNGYNLDLVHGVGKGEKNNQGSTQVTVQLASGDRVWIRNHSGTTVRGSWWTVFSGFKLN